MPERRRLLLGTLVLLVLLGPVVIDLCFVSDEEAIEALIERAEQGIQDQDADQLMELITEDFAATVNGRALATPAQLQVRLQRVLAAYDEIRVDVDLLEIEVEGAQARVQARGFVGLRSDGAGFPGRFELRGELIREESGEWRVCQIPHASVRPGIR